MQRVLNPRTNRTSLDVERENFQKIQYASISKAVSCQECPVKEKHVRRVLIGTCEERGSVTFWAIVRHPTIQVRDNPISCWKFCHVLHKILREGGGNLQYNRRVLNDAYRHREMLQDLGKMWGLLREGYGKLIQCYCKLLLVKIEFHANNQRFPGNLQVSDEELERIGENDVNIYFQLCCELFDYLDEILNLQAAVFDSLDRSRSNSMTNAGQCRLAPLIPCIQDSSALYDYIVKVLFKLHAALPGDALEGHRGRFLSQFKILSQFYLTSSNLQYFKNLVQVPTLPHIPPNFLVAADLHSHVTPIVVVPQQSESPEPEAVDFSLVDLSFPHQDARMDDFSSTWSGSHNGSLSPNPLDDKNRVIERLTSRIEELQVEARQADVENGRKLDDLKRRISEMECNAVELERRLTALTLDKENIAKENEELRAELGRMKAGTDVNTELVKEKEKLSKFKEVYNKLRGEHIELLRSKADIEKQLISSKAILEKQARENDEIGEKLKILEQRETEMNATSFRVNELQRKLDLSESRLQEADSKVKKLEQEKASSEMAIKSLTAKLSQFEVNLKEAETKLERCLLQCRWGFLLLVLGECGIMVSNALMDENSSGVPLTDPSSPESFFSRLESLKNLLNYLQNVAPSLTSPEPQFDGLISSFIRFSHQLCLTLNCGKFISHTLPSIDLSQELDTKCLSFKTASLNLIQEAQNKVYKESTFRQVADILDQLIRMKSTVLPEMASDVSKDIGKLLMEELNDMDAAIREAASKIESIMMESKQRDTGVKLQVNENILDACTTLMQAIMELIKHSRELQNEIIAQGKGSFSANEFYQRNSRWTEGLISAAKVVALAAKLLVDAADKVVKGSARFEELMVASQEIAAATAQLVVASRVKAKPSSQKLAGLSESSKKVNQATGKVVATTKNCAELLNESTDQMDFNKLSLHQAKRLEMDSQIRVLELEKLLEMERVKLAGLRKRHYHLAGNAEGWDAENT